jgi:hypothetical protein
MRSAAAFHSPETPSATAAARNTNNSKTTKILSQSDMDISFEILNHASRANSAGGADRLEREIRSHVTTQRKFGVNSEVMTDSRIRSNTSRPPAMQRPLVRRPLRWVNTPSLLPPPALRRITSFDSSRPRGCADLATPGRRNTLLATNPALQPIAPPWRGRSQTSRSR